MLNISSATVEGFVTHEPVSRETKTGKKVCNFSVAINHFSGPDAQPKVSYIDIETWEKVADICTRNVNKGKRVMVIGELRQDRWEGKDGRIQSKIKVIGNHIRFLGRPLGEKNEE